MRKFLFSGAVIAAAKSGMSLLKESKQSDRDWLLLLTWLSWGLTAAVAIGGVVKGSRELEREHDAR